jgi:hypothetical protein
MACRRSGARIPLASMHRLNSELGLRAALVVWGFSGAGVLPLTFLRLVLGPGLGGWGLAAVTGAGGADRVGAGQDAAAGGPQAASQRLSHSRSRCHGEVQGEVPSAVAGGAGGDRDRGGADGRGPGLREGPGGEGAGGADQVEGHSRDDQPRGVGGEPARREVRKRPAAGGTTWGS